MAANDKDYKLTHEQLIKVCKVLLHKVNCVDIKNGAERDSQNTLAEKLYKNCETSMRS